MKKIFKKNQIIVTVLAILIVVAGYLKYTDANFQEKNEEAANEIYESTYETDDLLNNNDIASLDENLQTDNEKKGQEKEEKAQDNDANSAEEVTGQPGEAVMTSSKLTDFIIQARIDREQVRSKNKDALLEVINNDKVTEAEKKSAVEAMVELTKNSDIENTIETLLEAKGFHNVIVTISENQVDVILDDEEITNQERAQIEQTIKRKTEISSDKIVITPAHK